MWRTALPPHHDEYTRSHDGQQKHRYWCDPRSVIESSANRCSKHGRAILRRKPVENCCVRSARSNLLAQLANHAVGVRTPYMVALQQNLTAAAHADHLVAKSAKP